MITTLAIIACLMPLWIPVVAFATRREDAKTIAEVFIVGFLIYAAFVAITWGTLYLIAKAIAVQLNP